MKVLVTGANGFVGQALTRELRGRGMTVVAAMRHPAQDCIGVGEIDGTTDWSVALRGCTAVVHAAACVHQMKERPANAKTCYQRTNVEGTTNLARQAAAAGVKRFIFLSSIKAMGEAGHFTETTPCHPQDAYGKSKLDAENALRQLSAETALEVVILRLPLVYGPGVKGNFASLMRMVEKGIPFPLGAVRNARSLLYLENLTDIIALCLTHASVVSRVWLPSDGTAVSTSQLLRGIASVLDRRAMLLRVSPLLMLYVAHLLGKRKVAARLLGDLKVDSDPLFSTLGWKPPFTMADGLKATAQWYRHHG